MNKTIAWRSMLSISACEQEGWWAQDKTPLWATDLTLRSITAGNLVYRRQDVVLSETIRRMLWQKLKRATEREQ